MEALRFWGLVLLVVVLIVGLTILLMRIFEKRPMVKYIPTIIIWLLSIFLFIMGRFFAEPMQDLGYYVMAMITGVATFIALIITIFIEKAQTKKRKK
jgi:predicted tellurium resistance membrane protein TerC